MDNTLFPIGRAVQKEPPKRDPEDVRVQHPVRNQVEIIQSDLDTLIPDDHQARTVWSYVTGIDTAALYEGIKAVEGGAGRTPIDPKIILALWLYATLDGVGSGRALARLCEDHVAYRWICGGVSVNHHTLSDFRSQSGDFLDQVLTDSIVALRVEGLVTLNRVAHDGMRVRASAGKSSFRRKKKLEQFRREAEEQVQALRRELEADPAGHDCRRRAASERAARERQERIEAALRAYPSVREKTRDKKKKDDARVSTTDADARNMRMADGGFRPAYNIQLTTDTATQTIIGVDIIQSGSDGGLLGPAVEQLHDRYQHTPKEVLADAGYAKRDDIVSLTQADCTVYTPVPELKKHGKPAYPSSTEPAEMVEWRKRMQTQDAKDIYKERASSIECVNAQARNRGLQQFRVRGVAKVRAVVLLFVLAHNLMRIAALMISDKETQ